MQRYQGTSSTALVAGWCFCLCPDGSPAWNAMKDQSNKSCVIDHVTTCPLPRVTGTTFRQPTPGADSTDKTASLCHYSSIVCLKGVCGLGIQLSWVSLISTGWLGNPQQPMRRVSANKATVCVSCCASHSVHDIILDLTCRK
jgi:hypothetical protein